MYNIPGFASFIKRSSGVHKLNSKKEQVRFDPKQNTWTPGPGAYTAMKRMGKDQPSIKLDHSCARSKSMVMVNLTKQGGLSPGPAAYSSEIYSKVQNHHKPKPPGTDKPVRVERTITPGPAAYTPGIPRDKPKPQMTKFGRARQRPQSAGWVRPGPGAYKDRYRHTKIANGAGMNGTIGKAKTGRGNDKPGNKRLTKVGLGTDSPGPSAYAPKTSMHDPLGQKGGKSTFGTCARFKKTVLVPDS